MDTAIEALRTLIDSGTEEEVREYIAQHFSAFPEEFQKEVSVLLFREALQEDIAERETLVALKKRVAEVIKAIDQA